MAAAKDFATVAGMFADDIVWHQPGGNRFSGTHRGGAAVNEMIGGMMTVSEGTFELALTGRAHGQRHAGRGSRPLLGEARRRGDGQDGVDLLRVEGDRIAEVWLFSTDPPAEDAFWGVG